MPAIATFWDSGEKATSQQYLAMEEFTVLNQVDTWKGHRDPGLSDLAGRFMNRIPFAMIESPKHMTALTPI